MLGIGIFINMQDFVYSKDIQRGYQITERMDVWGETIAESINAKTIYLTIDGKPIEMSKEKVYMDESLNLMLPVSLLTNNFNCSARFYDEQTLIIEQNELILKMNLNEEFMSMNGTYQTISAPLTRRNNQLYIPIDALMQSLKCQYTWDIVTNSASIINVPSTSRQIPYVYDYRNVYRDPLIKDQGKLGTCWAFASLTALESSLLPEEEYDFSEDHMSLNNGFSSEQNDGGEYTMAIAYLASWQGPVLEEEDLYGDGESPDGLNAVKHVQEVQVIEGKDFEKIKEMVYKYGGVQSSLYTSMTNTSNSKSRYYNPEKYSYCYIGTEKPNHDVVIIGWDDNYPKENFNVELEANGAFICRNSWGTGFGDNGTFYVSYYDTNIGIHNVAYTRIDDIDNYENIYQADLCGWVGQLGYGKDRAYFANVYQSQKKEELKAVSFYATGKDTEYEIYIVRNFENTASLNDRELLKAGKFNNAGYYTVDLKEGVIFEEGERFAVVIKIITPNSERPIAIEYAADHATEKVDLSDGEGYISLYGKAWESAEQTQGCNICLKVFTNGIEIEE